MYNSVAYAFKICPVSSSVDITEFQKFIQRLVDRYGKCRITPCAKRDCKASCNDSKYIGMRLEFGSHFVLQPCHKRIRRLNDLWDAAFEKKYFSHKIKSIVISNEKIMLDLTSLKTISSDSRELVIELGHTKSMFASPAASRHVIPLYDGLFIDKHRRLVIDLSNSKEFLFERGGKYVINQIPKKEKRSKEAYSIQDELRKLWLSGKYSFRDLCAEAGCKNYAISFSDARTVLRDMPEPCR